MTGPRNWLGADPWWEEWSPRPHRALTRMVMRAALGRNNTGAGRGARVPSPDAGERGAGQPSPDSRVTEAS